MKFDEFFSTLGVVCVRGGSAVLSFLIGIIITRSTGTQISGAYFVIIALVTFLSGFSRFGTINLLVKYTSILTKKNEFEKLNFLLERSLLLVLSLSIVITLFLFTFSSFISQFFLSSSVYSEAIRILVLSIPSVAISGVYAAYINGKKSPILAVFYQSFISNFLFILLLIIFDLSSFHDVALSYTVANSLSCLLVVFLVSKKRVIKKKAFVEFPVTEAKSFWQIVILNQTQQWGSQLLGAVFLTTSESSYLGVCSSVAGIFLFVIAAIATVFSPRFAVDNDIDSLHISLVRSIRISLLLVFPIFVSLAIFSSQILNFYGEDYLASANVLFVLVAAQFLNLIFGPTGSILMMTGHQNSHMKNTTISVITLLISIPFFTSENGIMGVAVANLLSIFCLNLLNWHSLITKIHISPFFVAKKIFSRNV